MGSELDPREFSASARRHLRHYVSGLGLSLDALAADFPGPGLVDPADADRRVDHFRRLLQLCRDLHVPRAIVPLGGFDDPRTGELAGELLEVVAESAAASEIDTLVVDPTQEPAKLADRLRRLGCPQLHLLVDTAFLPTASALDPAGDLVRSLHLRDVRRGPGGFEEVPFGQGQVDFVDLLARLEAGAAAATLAIRHDGRDGVDALRQGRDYMHQVIGRLAR